jgi:hypothetical protein
LTEIDGKPWSAGDGATSHNVGATIMVQVCHGDPRKITPHKHTGREAAFSIAKGFEKESIVLVVAGARTVQGQNVEVAIAIEIADEDRVG